MNRYNDSEIWKTELSRLVDFLPYPIILWSREQAECSDLFFNAKFISHIGYTIDQIPSRMALLELLYPDQDYRNEILSLWRDQAAAIDSGEKKFIKMKVHLTCGSGERKWFKIKASVLENLFIVAYIDINSDVMLQEELKKANSNNDMMLSILGHDLRSPLANLTAIASLAENKVLSPEEFVPMMREIREESLRVLDLLDTSFSWARLNFNSLNCRTSLIDFDLLSATALQGVKLACERKNITITTDLGRLKNIETDFEILSVILRNLVSNAVKFTPFNGLISLTSTVSELIITDNGTGMGSDTLRAIKNQGVLPCRGTDDESGTGLGLRLVFSLAQKINCRLEIQSAESSGTAVRVIFRD